MSPARTRLSKDQIRIISEGAGVVPEMVQEAFCGQGGRISELLKKKIFQVAADQGVTIPRKMQKIRQPKVKKSQSSKVPQIAVLWEASLAGNSYFEVLLKYICIEALEKNVSITVNPIEGSMDEYVSSLSPFDGLVAAGYGIYELTALKGLHVPVITFGCDIDWTADISVDSRSAIELAVNHLVEKGHRQIGYLSPKLGRPVSAVRWDAFNQVMRQKGLPISPDHVSITEFLPPAGQNFYEDLGEYLIVKIWGQENRPTALVCYNDSLALGVMKYCQKADIRIPEDISLVSIDNIPESATCTPGLTTVSVELPEMGRKALTQMEGYIKTGTFLPEKVFVSPRLVERSSVRQIH